MSLNNKSTSNASEREENGNVVPETTQDLKDKIRYLEYELATSHFYQAQCQELKKEIEKLKMTHKSAVDAMSIDNEQLKEKYEDLNDRYGVLLSTNENDGLHIEIRQLERDCHQEKK